MHPVDSSVEVGGIGPALSIVLFTMWNGYSNDSDEWPVDDLKTVLLIGAIYTILSGFIAAIYTILSGGVTHSFGRGRTQLD